VPIIAILFSMENMRSKSIVKLKKIVLKQNLMVSSLFREL